METVKKSIDNQLRVNQGKNLFYLQPGDTLHIAEETVRAIERIGKMTDDQKNVLIDYATDNALREFCRINQYLSFDTVARQSLRKIYISLFATIMGKQKPTEIISRDHFKKLKSWLQKTNPHAESVYTFDNEQLQAVPCSEYSIELQLDILHLQPNKVEEPLLDIGCGPQGPMVAYLRSAGLEAYGIDRFAGVQPYLVSADWLEYDYGISQWGTIISNIGFSNHFIHHNEREGGDFLLYAKKYMEIVQSLKPGGSFHYAPHLPFIEEYLDKETYTVTTQIFGSHGFSSAVVKRLV